jgi:hypothetical protein
MGALRLILEEEPEYELFWVGDGPYLKRKAPDEYRAYGRQDLHDSSAAKIEAERILNRRTLKQAHLARCNTSALQKSARQELARPAGEPSKPGPLQIEDG